MSILKEFKEFAVKGNAVDMAVGIIIGAALKEYRKRNGSGAVYDDPRVAVGAGRFDEVGARCDWHDSQLAGGSPAIAL